MFDYSSGHVFLNFLKNSKLFYIFDFLFSSHEHAFHLLFEKSHWEGRQCSFSHKSEGQIYCQVRQWLMFLKNRILRRQISQTYLSICIVCSFPLTWITIYWNDSQLPFLLISSPTASITTLSLSNIGEKWKHGRFKFTYNYMYFNLDFMRLTECKKLNIFHMIKYELNIKHDICNTPLKFREYCGRWNGIFVNAGKGIEGLCKATLETPGSHWLTQTFF